MSDSQRGAAKYPDKMLFGRKCTKIDTKSRQNAFKSDSFYY